MKTIVFLRALASLMLNAFRTQMRNKLSLVILLFSFVLFAFMTALTAGSLSEEDRLLKDIGLFLISAFSALTAVILSAQLIYQEIEQKSIYGILSKPISRGTLILGKYLGTAVSLFVFEIIMAFALYGCAFFLNVHFNEAMGEALILIYVEALVISAITIFFGSFSTGNLAGLLGFGIFVVGRLNPDVQDMIFKSKYNQFPLWFKAFLNQLLMIIPDFSKYNLTEAVVYDGVYPWSYVWHLSLSGFAYIGICLILAAWIFNRRDLI